MEDAGDLGDAYSLHAAEIYRVIRAIVGNQASAEDLTQEAFIRAQQNLHRFDRSRPIRPWLITIAVRLALDHLRRERVRRFITLAAGPRELAPSPLRSIDTRMDIDAALRALAPKERAVVVARHYVGMSYREIGEMLATSPGNAGTLLHRAHARLRIILASDEPPSTKTNRLLIAKTEELIDDD